MAAMLKWREMKRTDALATLSRRHFCGCVAGGLGAAALASCSSSGPSGTPDATTHQIDAANNGACSTGGIDVGAPSTFVLNTPRYFSSGNFFVVRDSGGLYALTAQCTHQGATVVAETSDFYCPRHGATFDFDGNVLGGPAFQPLGHYAMCTLANGHVGVDTSQKVAQSQRLNA